jgi:hypothetical protein
MKDSLLIGMVLGLMGGALLFKHSPVAKDIVNKGEAAIRKEISTVAKDIEKKTAPNTQKTAQ